MKEKRWPGKGREYADCDLCNMTTDPDADVPGVNQPGDVTVVRTENGFSLRHERCHRQGEPKSIKHWM